MRIGLLIYGSPDTLSGGYLYDRKLVEYLREAGDSVEIVSLPWRNYTAHLTDNFSARLYRRLRDLRVDVLLQDELNHPSLALLNRRLRRRYRMVGIVHHLRSNERHPRWLLPLYRAIERSYLRTLDGFIFNSRTTRQAVEALRGEIGALPSVIAYPAADHLAVPDDGAAAELVRAREDSSGPLRVLFVGNLIPRKGLHHLLAALSRLPPSDWQLNVVGDDTVDWGYSAGLRRQIAAGGLEDNICLRGRVSDRELAQEYRAAHVLAVPSSYEGFGIVYLEGMAYGLPVLAGVQGAGGELVRPDVNGFLVEPGDAHGIAGHLSALAGDRRRLAVLGRNARRRFDSHPRWADSAAAVRQFLVSSF
ncbi:MAG: glycosyltransferase family 4 protein [Caldilineaceae bacterium]|nr:glycosyltransferase family 4 protein [Caldilineaceae bacterium]